MIELLAAAALAPWAHPLAFRPLGGWSTGASGNVPSRYGPAPVRAPKASTAWIARNVRYRDPATEDPPDRTLALLPSRGVIVWAVIFESDYTPRSRIRLDLSRARHLACCEGADVAGGMDELAGSGPRQAYSVIVRVFYGSRPTRALRAEAQRALGRLALPPLRQPGQATGSSTTKREPPPSRLSTQMRPFMRRTSSRQM